LSSIYSFPIFNLNKDFLRISSICFSSCGGSS